MTAASAGKVPLSSTPGSARTPARFVPAIITRSLPGAPALRVAAGSRREPFAAAAWMLAIAVSFLSAGLAGVARPVLEFRSAGTAKIEPPPEVPVEEIRMADLADTPDEPEAAAGPPDQPPAPADEPPDPLLTAEDIYEVPPAPPLETAMRIYEPALANPKPTPAPQPRRAVPAAPRPAAAAPAPAAKPSPPVGGTGGTAASGRGGKGKFPPPPYPAFAKAKGLTGTVTLSVRVSAAGDVTSASVAGSCGASELDAHAAAWVTRRWKWPAGPARSFRLPVTFRLR